MTEIYLAEAIFRVIRERRDMLSNALIFNEVRNMEHYKEIIGGITSLEAIDRDWET